jgi:hypothetical protein
MEHKGPISPEIERGIMNNPTAVESDEKLNPDYPMNPKVRSIEEKRLLDEKKTLEKAFFKDSMIHRIFEKYAFDGNEIKRRENFVELE